MRINQSFLSVTIAFSILASGCRHAKNAQDDYGDLPVITLEPIEVESKPTYKGSAKKDFILEHTKLEITPDWESRTLKGKAELTIRVGAYAQDTLVLDARGMELEQHISFSGFDGPGIFVTRLDTGPNYRNDGKKIHIPLPGYAGPGKEFKVWIHYTAHPEEQLKNGLIDNSSDQGLYFINPDDSDSIIPRQLWTQGEVKNSSAWFPTIDEPNQKMTQEIYLTVDTSLVTLSNGELVYSNLNGDGTRTDYWQLEKPHAPYLAMIAAGEWTITEDAWRDSIPVQYYLEERYAAYARTIFGATPEMMEFFSKRVGVDYPWPKFSQLVARDFVTGAMENTTAVIHYEPVQHDKRQHLDNTQEDIIAHELFHHWFGDLVTCESWAQVALNESLATLGESLWLEHKYGADEAALHMKENLDAYLAETVYTVDAIINHYYTSPDNLFDAHRYQKGALVMNMLRDYLGDTVFFKSLRSYLLENAYQTVEFSDLRKAFEGTSGEDLQWFFTQWFEKPGHPVLEILHEYQPAEKRYQLVVHQRQTFPNVPVYRIPVQVDIYASQKEKSSQTVWLKNWSDTFYFPANVEPLFVNFDAKKILLCQKSEVKSAKHWYAQFMNGSMPDKSEAMEALGENKALGFDSLINLTAAGMKDSFWYIRKKTIERFFVPAGKITGKHAEYAREFAMKDPDSRVRTAAINFLAGIEPSQEDYAYNNGETFYAALKDSSYMVVTSAVRALLEFIPSRDSLQLVDSLKPLEDIHGPEVLIAVGEVYTRYRVRGKEPFFHHAYVWMPAQSMSRYVDVYRRYLATQPFTVLKGEEQFILGIGNRVRDLWATILYRNMLLSFAAQLEKVSDADSGLSQAERETLAKRFKAKADSYKMEQGSK